MNQTATVPQTAPVLTKINPCAPALKVVGGDVVVKAGTVFGGRVFADDTAASPSVPFTPGCDYGVLVFADTLEIVPLAGPGSADMARDRLLGGFHFAPGGNAPARAGGDEIPQINPCSLWDTTFRPACPDPRAMALVEMPGAPFWCDIYLLGVDHLEHGTSAYGATIADGGDRPRKPGGALVRKLDYATAVAIMSHHGKSLLSFTEFAHAAYGVSEKTVCGAEPKATALDPPHTSRVGLMQASGNMWVWGHDGDPELPRASIFGGSWWDDAAGSRRALVGCGWPGDSSDGVGVRGRSDHLQPD